MLLAALVVLALAGPAQAQTGVGQVVVVGVPGLRWQDVGPGTPALARLAGQGAVSALSVKALPTVSCAADGWLTLGAGARAEAVGVRREPCDGGLPPDPAVQREHNADSRDGAAVGALTEDLPVRLEGPGAHMAAGRQPDARTSGPADAPLRLVDLGAVAADDRVASAARVDARLAGLLAGLPDDAVLLVVGLSAGAAEPREQAHLQVALAFGRPFPRGALTSPSTRRSSYVQLVDVAPTVLALLGRPVPDVMDGQPWLVAGPALGLAGLVDLDVRAVAQQRATVPFFVVLAGVQLVLLALLRRQPARARIMGLAGVAALGASYAVGLVPWWRAGQPLPVLVAMVAVVALLAALAVRRSRHALGWVCGGTAMVIAADLLTGAHLQVTGVAGYSPLVAGRFAGIGNVAFGVYAACALLATASLAAGRPRRTSAALVAVAGAVAVAVDGVPQWGSDVGGVLALLPAYVVLGLRLTGARVSVVRLALAGLAAAAVVTAFALADWTRAAADRTHLGRFVEQVRDGTAGDVLQRKAGAVLGLVFANPVTATLPLVLAAVVLLFLRPPPVLRRALEAVPAFRAALAAVAVAGAVGFAVNDSGAAVPALTVLVVLPATVAVTAGVLGRTAGSAR